MPSASRSLRRELRRVGISSDAIEAVWPEWWSETAEGSTSAVAELRYTVARRLGLSPRSLFDGPPRFVWRDEAKFKNLGAEGDEERAALTSFGIAVGRVLLAATPRKSAPSLGGARSLRDSILRSRDFVEFRDVLATCWSLGVPVVQLAVFPLGQKRMHAMTVHARGRFAILLGRESSFPSQVAYTIAHELGHIAMGHIADSAGLVEMGDPLQTAERDEEESAADAYALELLTGSPEPLVLSDTPDFSSRQLARAALEQSVDVGVAPGMLALCLGHSTGRWRQAFGALKLIPPGQVPVASELNRFALTQMDLDELRGESRTYLLAVLGVTHDR